MGDLAPLLGVAKNALSGLVDPHRTPRARAEDIKAGAYTGA